MLTKSKGCTSLKFSIFQKLVLEDKIVALACLPTFVVEKYVCALRRTDARVSDVIECFSRTHLLVVVGDTLGLFVPLEPHHVLGVKPP